LSAVDKSRWQLLAQFPNHQFWTFGRRLRDSARGYFKVYQEFSSDACPRGHARLGQKRDNIETAGDHFQYENIQHKMPGCWLMCAAPTAFEGTRVPPYSVQWGRKLMCACMGVHLKFKQKQVPVTQPQATSSGSNSNSNGTFVHGRGLHTPGHTPPNTWPLRAVATTSYKLHGWLLSNMLHVTWMVVK
jgi:hypothetical protein